MPKIYLEHDPPQEIPTDTKHVVNDAEVTVVHVTHFNNLMWDSYNSKTHVIDHGIHIPSVRYSGHLRKGIVVFNNLDTRGRRLVSMSFLKVREHVPLDLIGMGTEKLGGLGEILHPALPEISQYRFFFNPIRYTSLGLAVLEAMTLGIPVVGLATTEMVTVIRDGHSGILHTNIDYLIDKMHQLLEDHSLAVQLGEEGKRVVLERFNIERFANDWYSLIAEVTMN